MKKNCLLILCTFLVVQYFGQNLIPNQTSFFVSGTTGLNNTSGVNLFDNIDFSIFDDTQTYIIGNAGSIVIDLKEVRKLVNLDFAIISVFSTSYSFKTTISTGPTAIGPWIPIDNFFTSVPGISSGSATRYYFTNSINSNGKVSQFYKIDYSNFTPSTSKAWFTEYFLFEAPPLITSSLANPLLNGDCTTLSAVANGETYLWSTGETTQSISVCNSGTYSVSVTNTSFTGNQDHTASISVSTLGSQDNLPGPNGEVYSIYKNGNNVYIGGDFNAFGPITGSGAEIDNITGVANTNLPRVDGTINAAISDDNGGWYIGGLFTRVGNYSINNLAHIYADNSVDINFKPEPNGAVYTLAKNGTSLYAGGAFTTIQSLANNYMAKIDISNGSPIFWNANLNGIVRSIQLYADKIIIGGSFTALGGATRNYLGAVDTVFLQATTWNPNPNAAVYKVYSSGTKLYVGGDFTTISSVSKSRGAGYTLPAFSIDGYDMGANGRIHDFILNGTVLYAAGTFTIIGGANRNYLAGLNYLNALANTFNASANGIVNTIGISGGNLIVGGAFSNIGGADRNKIAALNLSTGVATTWNPNVVGLKSTTPNVLTLAFDGNSVYAGGLFYSVGASVRNNLASIDATTGLLTSWNPNVNNIVRSLWADDNYVYLGGDFTAVNGSVAKNRIAQLNVSNATATGWNPNADNSVNALVVNGTAIFVGGSFSNIGGAARAKIASLSTSTGAALAFNPTANGNVNALTIGGDTLYIGGAFTSIGGQTRNRIASYKISTSTITAFNPNANNIVNALSFNNNKLYLGGTFTTVNSTSRVNLAEYNVITNSLTSLNPGFATTSGVNALFAVDSSLYQGGGYQYSNQNNPINNLSALNSASGSIGYWQPQPDDIIRTIYTSSDKVYVGGRFKNITSRYQPYFASTDIYLTASPSISSISSTSICLTNTATITGAGFVGITAVKIGGVNVPYTVVSANTINIIPITLLSGTVTVTNALGIATSVQTLTVNSFPSASISAGGATTFCQGSNVALNANIEAGLTYQWTLGGSNIFGETAASYTANATGNYSVIVTNAANCSDTSSSISIIVNPFPEDAATISGNSTVCQGENSATYTVPLITNATSYIWTIPSGAIGTSTTNSITLEYSISAISGNITVKGNNSCGDGAISTLPIVVNPLPAAAGIITGTSTVCQGQNSVTYEVPPITNATSYIWTIPNGATGTSTTNSIPLNYDVSATSGDITVTGNNTCGNGAISTLPITVDLLPVTAGIITGNSTVCQGQNSVTYNVPPVSNATSYIWTIPSGATGTSTTNSITLNYGISATSGDITVYGNNTCGNGAISTLPIIVNLLPVAAGAISGTSTVCQGQNSVTYNVPPITNASSYIWTIPSGATGASTTNSITLNYGISATSGDITVYGNNICGNGAISTLPITLDLLPVAAGTISGASTVCQGQNSVTYNVPPISNATSYLWTLPSGATGTSTTNSITLNYGISATSSDITVKGNNTCGNGAISTLPIIVNPLPVAAGTISGTATVCQGQNSVTYSVSPISNASSYIWTIPSGATGTSTTNSITLNYGISATSGDIIVYGNNTCGNGAISTLPITVNILPATPTISLDGNVLNSDAPNGNQWYNQNGIVNDAILQNFTVTENGDYYVVVTLLGCNSDESNVINVILAAVESLENGSVIKVYPNPVSNELIIDIVGNNELLNFQILNAIGQVVNTGQIVDKTIVQTGNFAPGVYILKLENSKTFEFKKIIKE